MADLPTISQSAQQLVRDPNATPDQLLTAMRNVLDAKKPLGFDTVHRVERFVINGYGGDQPVTIYDVYEKLISDYQTWIDGWRSGANAKSDYQAIVTTGKGILQSELDNDFESNFKENSPAQKSQQQLAIDIKDSVKNGIQSAANLVSHAGSDLADLAVKLLFAYVVTRAIFK